MTSLTYRLKFQVPHPESSAALFWMRQIYGVEYADATCLRLTSSPNERSPVLSVAQVLRLGRALTIDGARISAGSMRTFRTSRARSIAP